LNALGYKISRIVSTSETEVKEIINRNVNQNHDFPFYLNQCKLAMYDFDKRHFLDICNELINKHGFETVYIKLLAPFLYEIGVLWHTDTLKPVHEHFVSYLIIQIILNETSKLNVTIDKTDQNLYVLYLPENEIHEISLLFVNYYLIKKQKNVIFLGSSVSIADLVELNNNYNQIKFITKFTISDNINKTISYLQQFKNQIMMNTNNQLYMINSLDGLENYEQEEILIFKDVKSMLNYIHH